MNTNFNYYKLNNKYVFSLLDYDHLEVISEEDFRSYDGILYYLNPMEIFKSRRSYSISCPSHLFLKEESLDLLLKNNNDFNIPPWLKEKIDNRKVKSINTNYSNWEDSLKENHKNKWKVNLIALGDVGSTLTIGLRLMGGDCISEIGIYDRNTNRLNRWKHELNQIIDPSNLLSFPRVNIIEEEDLFNCDMFIFCASKGIPPVGSNVSDVRMAQFESNSAIISQYGKLARDRRFKGIFAVVSDPVDLLCKVALIESNKDENNLLDYKGLAPEQIIGYGLGVMNGRAVFYSEQDPGTIDYIKEGRVFGPHGEGLIVANSIENFNLELSDFLTDKTVNANKEVRAFGYKPFIAPSLSSGALSIIATIKGNYFYGSSLMKDVYMGSRVRLNPTGIEVEQLDLPRDLYDKIKETYKKLAMII